MIIYDLLTNDYLTNNDFICSQYDAHTVVLLLKVSAGSSSNMRRKASSHFLVPPTCSNTYNYK